MLGFYEGHQAALASTEVADPAALDLDLGEDSTILRAKVFKFGPRDIHLTDGRVAWRFENDWTVTLSELRRKDGSLACKFSNFWRKTSVTAEDRIRSGGGFFMEFFLKTQEVGGVIEHITKEEFGRIEIGCGSNKVPEFRSIDLQHRLFDDTTWLGWYLPGSRVILCR